MKYLMIALVLGLSGCASRPKAPPKIDSDALANWINTHCGIIKDPTAPAGTQNLVIMCGGEKEH